MCCYSYGVGGECCYRSHRLNSNAVAETGRSKIGGMIAT